MPTHAWRCNLCKRPMGQCNDASDTLHLFADEHIVAIEHAQLGTLIRCECGGVRAFSNGRVKIPKQLFDRIVSKTSAMLIVE